MGHQIATEKESKDHDEGRDHARGDNDDDTTTTSKLCCRWKYVAFVLVGCIWIPYWMWYIQGAVTSSTTSSTTERSAVAKQHHHEKNHTKNNQPQKDDLFKQLLLSADKLECASRLNITYSSLFWDIKYSNSSRTNDTTTVCQRPKLEYPCCNPTLPAPPIRVPKRIHLWYKAHDMNKQLANGSSTVAHTKNNATTTTPKFLDVVFLGDSITEHWRGTEMSKSIGVEHDKMLEVWNNLSLGDHAIPLGIAGDHSFELLYRIMQQQEGGELPDSLNPKAFWILIGTNDYTYCTKEGILAGNMAVLEQLLLRIRKKPTPKIILQGLLPRGRGYLLDSDMWKDFSWINHRLACLAQSSDERVVYFNGTSYFLTDNGTEINQTLMRDYIHPSLIGHATWGTAMVDFLKELGIWTNV